MKPRNDAGIVLNMTLAEFRKFRRAYRACWSAGVDTDRLTPMLIDAHYANVEERAAREFDKRVRKAQAAAIRTITYQ
jgi:hypothetical protein